MSFISFDKGCITSRLVDSLLLPMDQNQNILHIRIARSSQVPICSPHELPKLILHTLDYYFELSFSFKACSTTYSRVRINNIFTVFAMDMDCIWAKTMCNESSQSSNITCCIYEGVPSTKYI